MTIPYSCRCGAPIVPGSHTPGPGERRHGAHGLCEACYMRRRRHPDDPQPALLPGHGHNLPWMDHGICRTHPNPDLWFADNQTDRGHIEIAKWLCRRCPVRVECLDHALRNNEMYGVWGGLTPRERSKRRATSRRGAA